MALSKVAKAKAAQNYTPKADPKFCMTCNHFLSDKVDNGYGFMKEVNIRCAIGGFKVKKKGTCDRHEHAYKPEDQIDK